VEELTKYLRALLLLGLWHAQNVRQGGGQTEPRLELMLSDSGFSHKEISEMLVKSPTAVAKAVSRARTARRGGIAVDSQQQEGHDNG
jgi:biotin operon repressor